MNGPVEWCSEKSRRRPSYEMSMSCTYPALDQPGIVYDKERTAKHPHEQLLHFSLGFLVESEAARAQPKVVLNQKDVMNWTICVPRPRS